MSILGAALGKNQESLEEPQVTPVLQVEYIPCKVIGACTTLPVCDTKLSVKCPGVKKHLLSTNFGCKTPPTSQEWPLHEVKIFHLRKEVEKVSYHGRLCEKPEVTPADS